MKKENKIGLIVFGVVALFIIIAILIVVNIINSEDSEEIGLINNENTEVETQTEELEQLEDNVQNNTNSTAKVETKWYYDEDGNVTDGEVTLQIGDYVDYDCITGATIDSITSYEENNGDGDQTFNLSSYIYGWRVLGVDETTGQILLISEELIGPDEGGSINVSGRTFYNLKGKTGYENGENELNEICSLYGQGVGADGSRSIIIEDVNKITGFDPNEDWEYERETTYIYENGEISYYEEDDVESIKTSDHYTSFTYYTGSKWKTLESGESVTIKNSNYLYIGDSYLDSSTVRYKLLFQNSINSIVKDNWKEYEGSCIYWINSTAQDTGYGAVEYEYRSISAGQVYDLVLYVTNGSTYGRSACVRPVVMLNAEIDLVGDSSSGWSIN